ncbi:hypothetical protein AAKU52_003163 [Pedobacter sp. CG_S7]|uniref:family 16 glycoside hydrolase n=1 Tax=Pedobacter sp. CG_S7 TaxID=3143930 RepID=UPI00339410D7
MKTNKILILILINSILTGCEAKNANSGANTKDSMANETMMNDEKPDTLSKQSLETLNFEDANLNELPSGWTAYLTGKGSMPVWKVVDDGGNKVLAQLSKDNPSNHFNVVVYDGFQAKDVTLQVGLKGMSGRIDQGGGFVWRFKDADNYYVVRANPLENNVVLYKVENGKRTDLPLIGKGKTYGVDAPVPGNEWNKLKLIVKSDLFTVVLNEKELFQVKDNTFTGAGKVGFWTKADAVTYFDDFEIQ